MKKKDQKTKNKKIQENLIFPEFFVCIFSEFFIRIIFVILGAKGEHYNPNDRLGETLQKLKDGREYCKFVGS